MDSHFPYQERLGTGTLNKAWQLHLLQEVQCMRLHSPLVGVYGPSLTCRHWGFMVSSVDFVTPQVEAPSYYYVN